MFLILLLPFLRLVHAHAAIWTPAMWGYNVTSQTYPYDNRPVVPLAHMTFEKWWFHGHLDHPPHPDDIVDLPVGEPVTMQIACNKGATTFFASSEGGNIQVPSQPNEICPNAPLSEFHTTGIDDVKGCALAIAYKSDVSQVQPEDFTVFSVNHTCVWNRYTEFPVPKMMPPCPGNKCVCAFFWIHSPDSGSEQMYMNGFQCNPTNTVTATGLATPAKLARRCGADPANGKPNAVPGNCTYGPKQPLYWYQAERNNMFEGTYSPPFYNALYGFADGAQNDIFQGYYESIPDPGPNQTELPIIAKTGNAVATPNGSGANPVPPPASDASKAANPVATDSKAKAKCKRDTADAPARRDASERRSPFTHKVSGMTRRSRILHPEKRSDIWKPF